MRLIDADRFRRFAHEQLDEYNVYSVDEIFEMIDEQPTVEAKPVVPLSEIYRVIAGHSNYHGDSILSALTCIAEGKEVKPIKPLEEQEKEKCLV